MRAIYYEEFGDADVLKLGDLPIPVIGPNEVLMRVGATSVNPVDWKIREGWFSSIFPYKFPIIPGWDAAGDIADIGKDVSGLEVGERVYAYCRKPEIHGGTYADYVAVPASFVAPMPTALSFEEAATLPLTGLTAWQALSEFAQLKRGQTVLIHAASGGVGSVAVQIASHLGARVWATASAGNIEYVRGLGADRVIDYRTEDLAGLVASDLPAGFDVVFDTVGGDVLEKSYNLVKPGGALPALNDEPDTTICAEREIRGQRLFSEPNSNHLRELGKLIDEGTLKPAEFKVFALDDAAKAMELSQDGHVRGKLVITLDH